MLERVPQRDRRHADLFHRLHHQGLRSAVCRAQGQSRRTDDARADQPAQGAHAHQRWRRVGAVCRSGGRADELAGYPARRCRSISRSNAGMPPRESRSPNGSTLPPGEHMSTQEGFGRLLAGIARQHPRAGRSHRHRRSGRDGVDQPGRLGQPARGLRAADSTSRFRQPRSRPRRSSGRCRRAVSTSSSGLPKTTCSSCWPHSACRGRCSARGCCRSAPSTIRSLRAASMRSTMRVIRTRGSSSSRRRPGITLAPEGGAHQSIYTPLIGIGQPGLTAFEPALVDELAEILRWSLEHMQADQGGAVYLRLSTRPIRAAGAAVAGRRCRRDVIEGGYWLVPPGDGRRAGDRLLRRGRCPKRSRRTPLIVEDVPGAGLLVVTSPDRLQRGWVRSQRSLPVEPRRRTSNRCWQALDASGRSGDGARRSSEHAVVAGRGPWPAHHRPWCRSLRPVRRHPGSLSAARHRCRRHRGCRRAPVSQRPDRTSGGHMSLEVRLPNLGDAVTHARLTAWLKHEGDRVSRGQPIAEVETDKTTVEIEAPADGVLAKIHFKEGTDRIPIDALLASITDGRIGPVDAPASRSVRFAAGRRPLSWSRRRSRRRARVRREPLNRRWPQTSPRASRRRIDRQCQCAMTDLRHRRWRDGWRCWPDCHSPG